MYLGDIMWDKVINIENNLEYLRQESIEVELTDNDLENDILLLKEFSRETGCLAMAAVQLGILKRLIYVRNTNFNDLNNRNIDEDMVLINPRIIKMTGHVRYWEACASCLDNMGLVDRPYQIEVEYYDTLGKKIRKTFTEFEAVVFAHEYDHLNGILHMDRAVQVYNLPQEKRKEFRDILPNHGYEIISTKGIFEYKDNIKEKIKFKGVL